MSKKNVVTASELADFVFCKRGWWLRYNNKLPEDTEAMIGGRSHHESLAKQVKFSQKVYRAAYIFLILGMVLVLLLVLKLLFFP